jgi:CBS domain-containing protein
MSRTIRDIIRNQKILALPPETSVRVAARAMGDRNVGSVMVVEDGKLVGIFTERDALVRVLAAGLDPVTTQLSVVMVRKVLTISPDRSLVNALHRMRDNGFRHMPVVPWAAERRVEPDRGQNCGGRRGQRADPAGSANAV